MPATIDWRSVRPYGGSQNTGFEELCAQLARRECADGDVFERKGTPDAGVECVAIHPGGGETAWQAKYVPSFTDRWSQVDDSVRAALAGHPALTRYTVCVPFDLPDGRRAGQTSARQAWDRHVTTWTAWAAERSMAVEFVLWGASELTERLTRTENVGLVQYWFDASALGPEWFQERLDEAIGAAGPRYTPEVHVDVDLSASFEAFGRTEAFASGLRVRAAELRRALRAATIRAPRLGATPPGQSPPLRGPSIDTAAVAASAAVEAAAQTLARLLVELRGGSTGDTGLQAVIQTVGEVRSRVDALVEHLRSTRTDPPSRTADAAGQAIQTLYTLDDVLRSLDADAREAESLASASLLVLRGRAGTGKTHLMCDVARRRQEAGQPTVLLMGQRFTSTDDPWTQALRHLDLPRLSAAEFVGALEAAAEASGSRALVLVDALNEGAGKTIWPAHLSPFLAAIERSDWISVCLSVRSSYERVVLPEPVLARAVKREHRGFAGVEYDAARTFFQHYAIARPSAPLLNHEFQNPLFLKALCVGLHREGRIVPLPRGFHGVTEVFETYLRAVNKTLSAQIGYAERRQLVTRAVGVLVGALDIGERRWLPVDEAERLLEPLLSGRSDDASLLSGLLREGILITEGGYTEDGLVENVQIAFERLADYLIADRLLGGCQTPGDVSASAESGALAPLLRRGSDMTPGLAEALCVQVAETFGVELGRVVPQAIGRWFFGDAFRQSLVWRAPEAFSDETLDLLNQITISQSDHDATLTAVLTVATIEGHPLNALYLDDLLRAAPMPERDAWWGPFLHNDWNGGSTLRRLVEWAWAVRPDETLDAEALNLTAVTLAWTLASSNRVVRDRATKALVHLLTPRLDAADRLVRWTAGVDDPYVVERIYAAACGCALRSRDVAGVGRLAQTVYDAVFRDGTPPPHILLRDYARGVVERAVALGWSGDSVGAAQTRPPYRSDWPAIPTPEEIKPLMPDWSEDAREAGNVVWARNAIGASVFDGDFGRYIIGRRLSWLSVRLDEAPWQSAEEQSKAFRASLDAAQVAAADAFDEAHHALSFHTNPFRSLRWLDGLTEENRPAPDLDREALEAGKARAIDGLLTVLSGAEVESYVALREATGDEAPALEQGIVQRYVLWRVFDLGWTADLHEAFDNRIGSRSRSAEAAERIGKKYQWIAYHEILAYVSDRYQYRDAGDRSYLGPWQGDLRDLDPSSTLASVPGGTGWGSHRPDWWATPVIDDWETPESHEAWFEQTGDLPDVATLLLPRDAEGTVWVPLDAYLTWQAPPPLDDDALCVREVWYILHAYLVKARDVDPFMEWAAGVNFYGRWMPAPPEAYRTHLGEMGWSEAARYFERPYYGGVGWTRPERGCPVNVLSASTEYACEGSTSDQSVDDGYRLKLPSQTVLDLLGLHWAGLGGDFADSRGVLSAQDPTVHGVGPSTCLVRLKALREALDRSGLGLCWTLVGEKRFLNGAGRGVGVTNPVMAHVSGAYALRGDTAVGTTSVYLERPSADGQVQSDLLRTIPLSTPELS